MPKSVTSLLVATVIALSSFIVLTSSREKSAIELPPQANTDNIPQVIRAVDLDQRFSFCGESIPMDNFDVRERLDRELTVNTYRHSATILFLKKTRRYFPLMERILREEGVPTDLKYLAVAESGLRNAISPAGAQGLWQFMKGTGQEYGLEINSEVDERYHLEKATRAAAAYLRKLHDRFGSWSLAAAAYNMGGGNLNRNLEVQRASNYIDLNLNEETSRYYFRLVAIKYLIENPRDYGFYLTDEDYYPALDNYREVEITKSVANWGDFAQEQGTTYRMLKVYNPWLRESRLTNRSGKTYMVRVPKG